MSPARWHPTDATYAGGAIPSRDGTASRALPHPWRSPAGLFGRYKHFHGIGRHAGTRSEAHDAAWVCNPRRSGVVRGRAGRNPCPATDLRQLLPQSRILSAWQTSQRGWRRRRLRSSAGRSGPVLGLITSRGDDRGPPVFPWASNRTQPLFSLAEPAGLETHAGRRREGALRRARGPATGSVV